MAEVMVGTEIDEELDDVVPWNARFEEEDGEDGDWNNGDDEWEEDEEEEDDWDEDDDWDDEDDEDDEEWEEEGDWDEEGDEE